MKNLKKVLALVVVFSMMLCSVAFAAFPDVPEDADYANAVNTLTALGVISGDNLGNFNPDNTITRCEFTKIACALLGLNGDGNTGITAFADVAADHWAAGYINLANGMKINGAPIIAGMGDGNFAPESPVTYEQVVKMLVVTLGYEPMAAELGGWPNGYMAAAQSIGLLKNIKAPAQTDPAKRSLVAQLAYNALDCPIMEQTGYGTDKNYQPMDGSNDRDRKTLLTEKFDVVKLGGVVIANSKVAIDIKLGDDKCKGNSVEDEITLAYDNNYKSTNSDFELKDRNSSATLNANVGTTDAAKLFGQRVIAFVQDDGRDYTVIAIVAEDGKNSSIEISLADVDDGERTVTSGTGKLKLAYFESDTAKKSTQLNIDDDYAVIWNSTDDDYDLDDIVDAVEDRSARITLVDWDNDDAYDLIKVDEYTHYVVDEIDVDTWTIETEDGNTITVDPDDDLDVTIEDIDGNAYDFADIAGDDVLAVISDNVSSAWDYEEFIEIVVLPQSFVEGTVKSVDKNNGSKTKITIDSTVYEVDAVCDNKSKAESIGSEGAFYIGIDGQVVAFDGTKVANGNYGIILQTGDASSDFNTGYQIKILNKEGQAVIYDFASTIKLQGESGIDTDDDNEVIDLTGTDFKSITKWGDLMSALDTVPSGTTRDADLVKRMVQYKVNSSNEVTSLTFAANDTFEALALDEDAEFKASKNRLGSWTLDDVGVIFSISKTDLDKSKVITVDSLVDESEYKAVAFESDDEIAAVIILGGDGALTSAVDGWAVVTGTADTKDANDQDAVLISYVENGSKEVKQVLVTEDTDVDNDYNAGTDAVALAGDMGIGSLFLYAANADGEATAFAVIANVKANGKEYDFKIDTTAEFGTGSNKTSFVFGTIDAGEKLDDDLMITTKDGKSVRIDLDKNTNEYRFNNANSRNKRIEVGSYKGGNVVKPSATSTNFVVARIVDRDTVDFIAIDKNTTHFTAKADAGDDGDGDATGDSTPATGDNDNTEEGGDTPAEGGDEATGGDGGAAATNPSEGSTGTTTTPETSGDNN